MTMPFSPCRSPPAISRRSSGLAPHLAATSFAVESAKLGSDQDRPGEQHKRARNPFGADELVGKTGSCRLDTVNCSRAFGPVTDSARRGTGFGEHRHLGERIADNQYRIGLDHILQRHRRCCFRFRIQPQVKTRFGFQVSRCNIPGSQPVSPTRRINSSSSCVRFPVISNRQFVTRDVAQPGRDLSRETPTGALIAVLQRISQPHRMVKQQARWRFHAGRAGPGSPGHPPDTRLRQFRQPWRMTSSFTSPIRQNVQVVRARSIPESRVARSPNFASCRTAPRCP